MEENLVLSGNPTGETRKLDQPRINWINTMHKDLVDFEMTL